MPSTKLLGEHHGGIAPLDDRAWVVRFKRAVAVDVQRWGLANEDFAPTLEQLIAALELDPYQFPEKHGGRLADARAADLAYRGRTWRAVYDVDDDFHEVYILAIGEHSAAYDDAERRRYH
jgi:mRNA-degrading endonuclease RelE of RelBE toxin-antitoxin system